MQICRVLGSGQHEQDPSRVCTVRGDNGKKEGLDWGEKRTEGNKCGAHKGEECEFDGNEDNSSEFGLVPLLDKEHSTEKGKTSLSARACPEFLLRIGSARIGLFSKLNVPITKLN